MDSFFCPFDIYIKDTVEDELADAVIRLLDLAAAREINTVIVDGVRDRLAGIIKITKPTLSHLLYKYFLNAYPVGAEQQYLCVFVSQLYGVAKGLNIDLDWHIEQKIKYNKMREYLHGKKY